MDYAAIVGLSVWFVKTAVFIKPSNKHERDEAKRRVFMFQSRWRSFNIEKRTWLLMPQFTHVTPFFHHYEIRNSNYEIYTRFWDRYSPRGFCCCLIKSPHYPLHNSADRALIANFRKVKKRNVKMQSGTTFILLIAFLIFCWILSGSTKIKTSIKPQIIFSVVHNNQSKSGGKTKKAKSTRDNRVKSNRSNLFPFNWQSCF